MKINRFEEIIAWQKARDLNVAVFSIIGQHKNYGLETKS